MKLSQGSYPYGFEEGSRIKCSVSEVFQKNQSKYLFFFNKKSMQKELVSHKMQKHK